MDTSIAEAADYLSANNLLNCYVSEFTHWQLQDSPAHLSEAGFPKQVLIIPAGQQRLWIGVQYWSCCGRHRFLMPARSESVSNGNFKHLKFSNLAQVLVENAVHQTNGSFGSGARLVDKISENRRYLELFLSAREKDFLRLFQGKLSFRHSEQALLSGHPGNPVAKIRRPMNFKDAMQFAPEGGSGFSLAWILVRNELIRYQSMDDTSLEERLQDLIAADNHLSRLPAVPEGYVLVPAHPWQLTILQKLPQLAQAFLKGDIQLLGPAGKRWHPTSLMSTLYAEHAPFMLQFSMNIQSEEGNTFMTVDDAQVQMQTAQYSRDFHVPTNVAWLCLLDEQGESLPESIVIFRSNPVQEQADQQYNGLAALTQDHPWAEQSRLYWQVSQVAEHSGIPLQQAADLWFAAYLNNILGPLLTAQSQTQWCWRTKSNDLVLIIRKGLPHGILFQGNNCCRKGMECGVDTQVAVIQELLLESVFDLISTLAVDGLANEDDLIAKLGHYLVQHPAVGLKVESILQPILEQVSRRGDGFFRGALCL